LNTLNILVLLSASSLSACTTLEGITSVEDVSPWQRGILAQDNMQLEPDTMEGFVDDHIYFSKEASTGGKGVGGGGCGCN
jgi:hypothetical protein